MRIAVMNTNYEYVGFNPLRQALMEPERRNDDPWYVYANGSDHSKSFPTHAEAIAFADKLASQQP